MHTHVVCDGCANGIGMAKDCDTMVMVVMVQFAQRFNTSHHAGGDSKHVFSSWYGGCSAKLIKTAPCGQRIQFVESLPGPFSKVEFIEFVSNANFQTQSLGQRRRCFYSTMHRAAVNGGDTKASIAV